MKETGRWQHLLGPQERELISPRCERGRLLSRARNALPVVQQRWTDHSQPTDDRAPPR